MSFVVYFLFYRHYVNPASIAAVLNKRLDFIWVELSSVCVLWANLCCWHAVMVTAVHCRSLPHQTATECLQTYHQPLTSPLNVSRVEIYSKYYISLWGWNIQQILYLTSTVIPRISFGIASFYQFLKYEKSWTNINPQKLSNGNAVLMGCFRRQHRHKNLMFINDAQWRNHIKTQIWYFKWNSVQKYICRIFHMLEINITTLFWNLFIQQQSW